MGQQLTGNLPNKQTFEEMVKLFSCDYEPEEFDLDEDTRVHTDALLGTCLALLESWKDIPVEQKNEQISAMHATIAAGVMEGYLDTLRHKPRGQQVCDLVAVVIAIELARQGNNLDDVIASLSELREAI